MEKTAEELVDIVIDTFLQHTWFENSWYNLEEDEQENLKEEIAESIQGFSDDE
jgi:hypothetical protein